MIFITGKRLVPIFILLCIFAPITASDPLQSFLNSAASDGHRDIIVFVHDDTLSVSSWPMGHRNGYDGWLNMRGHIIKLISESNEFAVKQIILSQQAWGKPIIQGTISPLDTSASHRFSRSYTTTHPKKDSISARPSRKFLVLFDFPLSMDFGGFEDPFLYKTGLRSGLFAQIIPGNLISYAQLDIYAHNEYDTSQWFQPADLGAAFITAPSSKSLMIVNAGSFTDDDVYGLSSRYRHYFADDTCYIRVHAGIYSDIAFTGNKFAYDDKPHYCALVGAAYTAVSSDLTFSIEGGRYLYGDHGIGTGMKRLFGEVEIGFKGIYSDNEFNGYIDVSIPLFPANRAFFPETGITTARDIYKSYRYNSTTVNYDPTDRANGIEPDSGISFRDFERFAHPSHYRYKNTIQHNE